MLIFSLICEACMIWRFQQRATVPTSAIEELGLSLAARSVFRKTLTLVYVLNCLILFLSALQTQADIKEREAASEKCLAELRQCGAAVRYISVQVPYAGPSIVTIPDGSVFHF
jgi:hypothetical protein